jgi:hypothetical protein
MIMNKTIFEEKWDLIRSQSTIWWSLMADYDLNKVDKAEVKFDKFVTMLQVKYGYTRQQAREEISKFLSEHETKSRNNSKILG